MISPYSSSSAYLPQQSYGPVQSNYGGPTLYGYSNNPYGLYGQNPSYTLSESPYARLTNQPTQLSSEAIPNLSSFLQPMFVDMNAFMGGNSGIPAYPSFIGSTAMQNSDVPLYQTYQDYLNQQAAQQQQQQQYGYPQQYGYSQQVPVNYGYGQPVQTYAQPMQMQSPMSYCIAPQVQNPFGVISNNYNAVNSSYYSANPFGVVSNNYNAVNSSYYSANPFGFVSNNYNAVNASSYSINPFVGMMPITIC